jgi:HlyD family secretion protein
LEQAAGFQQSKVDDGTRRQIVESARQLWEKSRAELQLATTTHRRVESLWRDSIVPAQRLDEARTLLAVARAGERAARQQYEMAQLGAQRQDLESARALVEAARGSVDEVEALLRDVHLTSPAAGQVAAIYPRVGELVGAGSPLMNVVVLSDAYVVLNVREDYMPRFGMGDVFVGDVPALALRDVRFRIYYVSPLGSYATWRSARQAGSYDLRTFEIRARAVEPIEGLRPGMSVVVTI